MEQESFDAAVAEFLHAIGLLVRRVRAAGAGQNLSLTQSAVLSRLEKSGPATISELARAEGVKPQSMGAIVAGLEELEVVERRPDPSDGRQVTIELTPRGASVRKTVRDAKLAWLAQAIGELDEEEQADLFAAGEIIRRLVEV